MVNLKIRDTVEDLVWVKKIEGEGRARSGTMEIGKRTWGRNMVSEGAHDLVTGRERGDGGVL